MSSKDTRRAGCPPRLCSSVSASWLPMRMSVLRFGRLAELLLDAACDDRDAAAMDVNGRDAPES